MNNDTSSQKLIQLLIHLDGAYAPNTLRAYKADMLEFIAYCEKTGECALPASPKISTIVLLNPFITAG